MAKQLKLNLYKGSRGSRKPGAGRKRIHSKGVAHRVREKVQMRYALHVNFKYRTTIRHKKGLGLLKRAYVDGYSSLSVVRALGKLAKDNKMTVVLRRMSEMIYLDRPNGQMIKLALS